MSENSGIEWTTHTFNPWWGCTKVHAGCTNCYAESFDRRVGGKHWGNNPRRMVIGEWGKPAKWNAAAKSAGRVDRVFCASMCDLFEDYHGPVVDQQGKPVMQSPPQPSGGGSHQGEFWTVPKLRARVFEIVRETPNLLWLLLTKRPQNVTRMVPADWLTAWPTNVMTGTSPCDQETANTSVPALMYVPGQHFLSCEPLLGAVDLEHLTDGPDSGSGWSYRHWNALDNTNWCDCQDSIDNASTNRVHWVIVGCESKGRSTNRLPGGTEAGYWDAAASIINQCQRAGVPVFHKQAPCGGMVSHEMDEWPEPMRVREFPTPLACGGQG